MSEKPAVQVISSIITTVLSFWAAGAWGAEIAKPENHHSFLFMKDLTSFQLFVCWALLVNIAETVRK